FVPVAGRTAAPRQSGGGTGQGGCGPDRRNAGAIAMSDTFGTVDEDPFGSDAGTSERVLNQDEIDSLLGFDMDDGSGDDRSGIRAIINSALVSYERLPMLEIVFDRLVRLMTTSLRNFTSDNVEVSLDTISSIRFGD